MPTPNRRRGRTRSVRTVTAAGPGSLVMCTDGLWNYLPDADDIARFCAGTDAAAAARALVDYALQRRRPGQHHRRGHPDRRSVMSSAEQQCISGIGVDVDHNPYLAEGAGTVDAIVSIAVGSEMAADKPPERVEAIIIDCSTSMLSPPGKFDEAKRATAAAINEIVDGTYFTIVAGTEKAAPVYPRRRTTGAGERGDQDGGRALPSTACGPTAEPRWAPGSPTSATIAGQHPGALTHAILLTDGKDEHETPEQLGDEIGLSEGEFTCDCRGVGTDWRVEELRAISSALLGTVDIVADPADLADDFAAMMRASMAKSIPDLTLRLWTPAGARVAFVKQVAPTVEDLTHRRVDAGSQSGEYPLGRLGQPRNATTTSRSRSSRRRSGARSWPRG